VESSVLGRIDATLMEVEAMSDPVQEIAGLAKTASDQLRTSQEVIYELAGQNQEMVHALRARDLAIDMASSGQIAMADLPEKVAELVQLSEDDLELQEKVASYAGPSHTLTEQNGTTDQASAMSFLNPR